MRLYRLIFMIGCLGICLVTSAEVVSYDRQDDDINISGGIKADALFLNFLKKDAPGAVSGLNPGSSLGGFVQLDFTRTFGLRPELNLNYKRNTFSWETNEGSLKTMGIEIPVYVTAGWEIFDSHRIFIGLGPYTEFSYYAQWQIDQRKVDMLKLNEEGQPMIQNSQSGFGAMLGYEFGCGISIEASYKICYFNILQPNTSQGVSLYPQTVGFGIAYNFKKKK